MHNPGSGVIGGEGNEEIAAAGESGGVPAGGVVKGEAGGAAVPNSGAFTYNVEVMAL